MGLVTVKRFGVTACLWNYGILFEHSIDGRVMVDLQLILKLQMQKDIKAKDIPRANPVNLISLL